MADPLENLKYNGLKTKSTKKIAKKEDEEPKKKPIGFHPSPLMRANVIFPIFFKYIFKSQAASVLKEKEKEKVRNKVISVLFESLVDPDIGAITPQSLQKTLVELGVAKFLPESRINELIEAFSDGHHGENPTISKEAMTELFNVLFHSFFLISKQKTKLNIKSFC
jgi:hypothetical protein